MIILIDIGHPGHVHIFKNLINEFFAEGRPENGTGLTPTSLALF
jgi:hypothetical protein